MADLESLQDLEDQVDALEQTLGDAAQVAAGFDAEMQRMRGTLVETGYDVATLERGMGRGLRRAFDGVLLDGMKLSDALETMAQSMINATYNAAVKPVTDHFGGLLAQGGIGSLMGGEYFRSRMVLRSARGAGDAVCQWWRGEQPDLFPDARWHGFDGRGGTRGDHAAVTRPDGKLGVRGGGSAPINVVMNISTPPDAASFQRSQGGQIAAQAGRMLARGQRNR